MINKAHLAQLTPQRRAEVIYAEAKSELSNRLWRAALGGADSDGDKKADAIKSPFASDSLLELLAANGREPACHRQHLPEPALQQQAPVQPQGKQPSSSSDGIDPDAQGQGQDKGPPLGAPCDLGVNARYQNAIADAERRTGIPGTAIAAIVHAEAGKHGNGSWNPLSRNPRSSAAGLGQFLSGTWEGLAETKGTWLNEFAKARGWLNGSGDVRSDARAELLSLRYNGDASIHAVADFARNNLNHLKRSGLTITAETRDISRAAYLTHHLGLGDAEKFLKGNIGAGRARTLLQAQIGSADAEKRIASAGDATRAHRQWLLGYIDRNIRPDRFAA